MGKFSTLATLKFQVLQAETPFEVEIEDCEVEVEYSICPAERRTLTYPGCDAHIDDIFVTYEGKELDYEKVEKDNPWTFEEKCWDDLKDEQEYQAECRYDEMKERRKDFKLTNWRNAS